MNLSSQSPSLDVPQTVTVTPADQGVVNESQLSASIAVSYNRAQIIPPPQLAKPATDVRLRKSQFDASDGRLHSKTADYVNLLPESPSLDVPQTVTVTPAQGVVNESQLSVSMAVPHNRAQITPRDCVSLPLDQIPVACQGDISSSIDAEISQEASDVATATGEYKRRTLDHVPFDPFLSCLYCNKMFRFGEIQKYRKHVSTCTGYTAQK